MWRIFISKNNCTLKQTSVEEFRTIQFGQGMMTEPQVIELTTFGTTKCQNCPAWEV